MEVAAEDPAVAAPPESWETADLDGAMSRLLLSSSTTSASARRVASSPDLADDDGDAAAQEERRDPAGADDLVAQVDQFLREAIEKPRERLSGLIIRPHGSSLLPESST